MYLVKSFVVIRKKKIINLAFFRNRDRIRQCVLCFLSYVLRLFWFCRQAFNIRFWWLEINLIDWIEIKTIIYKWYLIIILNNKSKFDDTFVKASISSAENRLSFTVTGFNFCRLFWMKPFWPSDNVIEILSARCKLFVRYILTVINVQVSLENPTFVQVLLENLKLPFSLMKIGCAILSYILNSMRISVIKKMIRNICFKESNIQKYY